MFYTQIVFISCILEKIFLYISFRRLFTLFTTILTLLVFFFFRSISVSLRNKLSLFVFFFFRNILVHFTCFFLQLFCPFFFFDNNYFSFFIYKKKFVKKYFTYFLCALKLNFWIWVFFSFFYQNIIHLNFLHQNFLHYSFFIRLFCIKIRRNFYVVNNIPWNLFFFNKILAFF